MSKKAWRALAVVLVVGMLLTLAAGCGGRKQTSQPQPQTQPQEQKKEPVTVSIQMFSGPESEAMLPVVEYWNKTYAEKTGIKVNQITMSRVGYDEKMQSQLVSGSADPDVIHPFSLTLAKFAPYLQPLNAYLDNKNLMTGPKGETYTKDEVFKAAFETVTMGDGQIYMIPKDMSEPVLLYRKDIIANPPQTWDEYIETAKKYTQSINPSSPVKYGNTWQGKYELWNFVTALDVIWPYGGDMFKKGTTEPNFDNEGTVKAFKVFADLAKAKTLPPGVENGEFPEVLAALQNGEVAMAMQWNAAYGILVDPTKSPKVADKIGIAPPPGVKKADGTIDRSLYVQTINLAINKNSKHKEEAFKFLAWASFGEGAIMYAEKGGSSPIKSVWKAANAQPPYPQLAEYVEKWGRAVPPHEDMTSLIMIGSSWVQKVIIGKATPEEAAKGLNKEMTDFLAGRKK